MSQFMICKGGSSKPFIEDTLIISYPFEDNYLMKVCDYFWETVNKNDVWSIVDKKSFEIDSYFTDAQNYINQNRSFEESKLYKIINYLLNNGTELILWYSDYIEDIPITSSKEEFLEWVEEGIKDPMCEVYARYKINE